MLILPETMHAHRAAKAQNHKDIIIHYFIA